jgi:5-carboxymethyl-2-hydroxymuconate isomerase
MAHFMIDYSANLETEIDFGALCNHLRIAGISTGVFAKKGIRVRALRADHWSIVDGSPEHGYVHLVVRLRGGRDLESRKRATNAVFAAMTGFLADVIETRSIAVSMEMADMDPELSPKLNTIPKFMDQEA